MRYRRVVTYRPIHCQRLCKFGPGVTMFTLWSNKSCSTEYVRERHTYDTSPVAAQTECTTSASPMFYSHPTCTLSSPLFSLSPINSRSSDLGPHMASSPPPSPLRFAPCLSISTKLQTFLPSSTRVEVY